MWIIKLLCLAATISLQLFISPIALAASDCVNTPWVNSNGRTCASIGLNSKQPICNGQAYAVMCDDTQTQIRTCRSNVQCKNKVATDPYNIGSGTLGATNNNNGYGTNNSSNNSNNGTSGSDWEVFRGKKFHCTDWDYRNKRPCKSGTFNEDCWGNCS